MIGPAWIWILMATVMSLPFFALPFFFMRQWPIALGLTLGATAVILLFGRFDAVLGFLVFFTLGCLAAVSTRGLLRSGASATICILVILMFLSLPTLFAIGAEQYGAFKNRQPSAKCMKARHVVQVGPAKLSIPLYEFLEVHTLAESAKSYYRLLYNADRRAICDLSDVGSSPIPVASLTFKIEGFEGLLYVCKYYGKQPLYSEFCEVLGISGQHPSNAHHVSDTTPFPKTVWVARTDGVKIGPLKTIDLSRSTADERIDSESDPDLTYYAHPNVRTPSGDALTAACLKLSNTPIEPRRTLLCTVAYPRGDGTSLTFNFYSVSAEVNLRSAKFDAWSRSFLSRFDL